VLVDKLTFLYRLLGPTPFFPRRIRLRADLRGLHAGRADASGLHEGRAALDGLHVDAASFGLVNERAASMAGEHAVALAISPPVIENVVWFGENVR